MGGPEGLLQYHYEPGEYGVLGNGDALLLSLFLAGPI